MICKISRLTLVLFLIQATRVHATDLGTHGTLFPVKEESLLDVIQRRLKSLEVSGELEKFNQRLAHRAEQAVLRPKPAEGIGVSRTYRLFYYDPTLTLDHDIVDHQGRIISKIGTTINPLHYVSWGKPLIIIDGDSAEQVSWARQQEGKITLIKGSPTQLEQQLKRAVYFDQHTKILERFSIQSVPARISQEGMVLKIEEIPLNHQLKTGENS